MQKTEAIAGIQSFIDHSIEEQQAAGDEQAADRGTLSLIMRVSKSPCPACGQALIDFISNKYNGVSLQLSIIADHLYHGSTLDEARQTISDMEAVVYCFRNELISNNHKPFLIKSAYSYIKPSNPKV